MTVILPDSVILPGLFMSADRLSKDSRRNDRVLLGAELLLLTFAALASIPSVMMRDLNITSGLATTALLAALIFSLVRVALRTDETWYRARAVAESVKSLAWLYASGGAPFPIGSSDGADEILNTRLREILEESGGLDIRPRSEGQITSSMRTLRASSLAQRKDAYLETRVRAQIAWYSGKSQDNATSARNWIVGAVLIYGAGIVAGVLRFLGVYDTDLMGLAAAVAGAALSWRQSQQHQTLKVAYAFAAHDLMLIADRLSAVQSDDEWASFVSNAEAAISREHTMWLARNGRRSVG